MVLEGAFAYYSNFSQTFNTIEEVTLPDSMKTIGAGAFYGASIKHIQIPKNVSSIGQYAFYSDNSLPIFVFAEAETRPEGWHEEMTSSTIVLGYVSHGEVNGYGYAISSINGVNSANILSSNSTGNVVIPSTIEGYPVTNIGVRAFSNKQLTSVTIPNSVTTIGSNAFGGNQLTSVTIPNSVTTIGSQAFSSNQLTSVIIPNSVTTIQWGAFSSNPSLTIFTEATSRPAGWQEYINDSFSIIFGYVSHGEVNGFSYGISSINGANSVTILSSTRTGNVVIPSTIEGYPVTAIGSNAFSNKQLTSVTIPNSVNTIGAYAFSSNRLTSVTIPNSVTTIENG
jgi:hypothetical protein